MKNSSVNRKVISEFLGHYSPDFTEEVYVIKEDIAYDCSILETVWEEVKLQDVLKRPDRVGNLDF